MTQAAVSWLKNELSKYDIHKPISLSNWDTLKQLLEQAKAIEKQNVIDFAKKWESRQNYGYFDTIEMLYNETYNK
jgi:predicted Zn-dependent peptidase